MKPDDISGAARGGTASAGATQPWRKLGLWSLSAEATSGSATSGIRPLPTSAIDREQIVRLSGQIIDLKQRLSHTHRHLLGTQLDTVATLVAAVEAKDPHTERHSMHVSAYAERFARSFGFSTRQIEVLKTAAILHDVGKIGVPDDILTKPGSLTEEEYRIVKQHPLTGAVLVQSTACLQWELPLVLHHHEWYDGNGYPTGLRGEQIPLAARILQAADSIDAMLSARSYKESLTLEEVMDELRRGRGGQFDPAVTDVALEWLCGRPREVVVRGEGSPQSARHS